MIIFNESLTSRFDTLERNIKSKSNSFYDSYLDLLEATIKYFLDENGIDYDGTRTCGFLVKEEKVKIFLLQTLKLDDYTYNKLPDYIKKCNDHKHKKEKCLGVDSVINYLKVYFDLINFYIVYIKGENIEFDANYFSSIFGETERLNNEYKETFQRLKEELKDSYETNRLSEQDLIQYKELISIKDIELLNMDEQNKCLQEQISTLKDIKLNSMEEKLNKTIDMLNDMQDYLIENRILSKRTSKLIDGKEISDEELEEERKKIYKDRNENINLIDELTNQSQKIDAVAHKIGNMSEIELKKIAKLKFDTKDFKNAQKYYNQVVLLNPNDWEASLYASLCNYYGTFSWDDWVSIPSQSQYQIISTVEYVMNNDFENLNKGLDIVIKFIEGLSKNYFDSYFNSLKEDFIESLSKKYNEFTEGLPKKYFGSYFNSLNDKFEDKFIVNKLDEFLFGLEELIFNVYELIKNVEGDNIKEYVKALAMFEQNLIKKTKKVTKKISKENLKELLKYSEK